MECLIVVSMIEVKGRDGALTSFKVFGFISQPWQLDFPLFFYIMIQLKIFVFYLTSVFYIDLTSESVFFNIKDLLYTFLKILNNLKIK